MCAWRRREEGGGSTSQSTRLELLRDDWVEIVAASGPYFYNWRQNTTHTTIPGDVLPKWFRKGNDCEWLDSGSDIVVDELLVLVDERGLDRFAWGGIHTPGWQGMRVFVGHLVTSDDVWVHCQLYTGLHKAW